MDEQHELLERDVKLARHDCAEVDKALEANPGSASVVISIDHYRLMRGIVEQADRLIAENRELQEENAQLHLAIDGTVLPPTVGLKLPDYPIR